MVAVFRGARITDALIRTPPTFRCVWTGSLTRAYVAEVLCNGKALASGRIGSDCGNNVLKVLRAEIVPSRDFVVTLWGQARLLAPEPEQHRLAPQLAGGANLAVAAPLLGQGPLQKADGLQD